MSATVGERAGNARAAAAGGRSRAVSLVRGSADDAAWVRPSLLALLIATACLYLVDLASSGYANSFYSAAVQAGSTSWKAMLFGSFDSSNFITVDKPPAALWVMDLSARLFGVNAWSILVPQALEGVASVALLYATVRRRFSPAAGLVAGAVLATTPVAALMFRFNNPDALLTLLLVGSAYALTRALEKGETRWLVLAGSLVGFGFLAKMLQAFLVVPGFAAVYLLAAPVPVRRRLVQLAASGAAIVVSAGWWVATVALWPASSRPYVGGSQDNSILNLIFGYNGFGRITGDETGSVIGGRTVGAGGGGSMWGPTGITRLFGSEMGTQISWLLPAALVLMVATLCWSLRAARTDGRRAGVLIWGSWLVVTGLVLSLAQGIIHPYYTVVLAPAIGALVGIGLAWAWERRDELATRIVVAVAVLATGVWAFVLLDRTAAWLPWLRVAVVAGSLALVPVLIVGPTLLRSKLARASALAATLAVLLAAPVAYAVQTAGTAHSGSLPSAGPSGSVGRQGPGGGRGFAGGQGPGLQGPGQQGPGQQAAGQGTFGGTPRQGAFGPGGSTTAPAAGQAPAPTFGRGGAFPAGGTTRGGGGALGGLLDSGTPSKALVALLKQDASSYRWVAAVVGANSAAGVQLAADEPVMAIGGFNGTDPAPSLAEFEADVASGKVHYFVSGGTGAGPGGVGSSSSSSAIATWVASHFTAKTVGGVTMYDLTARSG